MRQNYFVLKFILLMCLSVICLTTVTFANEPISSSKCNEFTFDASASYDPDNENLSFMWDFGDGQTSNQATSNHTYTRSGDYNVILKITDNSGMECSESISRKVVRANIPPQASFVTDPMICANQLVSFDASASTDDANSRLNYSWDFGDGTQEQGRAQVSKAFSKGGNYKVTLTVDDGSATVCSSDTVDKLVKVNEPPVVNVGQEQVLKCAEDEGDMLVQFDASSSYDVNNDSLHYTWDFGDGTQDNGPKVSHRFNSVGNYDVKLIVKDNTDLGCSTAVGFVNVRISKAPKAEAGEDVLACPGDAVVFDGSNSYAQKKGVLSAKWFFGDGETSNEMRTTHSYSKPGQYQASLSVENELNAMCPPSKDVKVVNINAAPSVSIKASESACTGNQVSFDASSALDADGDSLQYYWSFGDGTILRAGPKVTHEYKEGGNYRVTVIVDDNKGTSCSTATAAANIRINSAPIADIGPNRACCVDKDTDFDATASMDPDGDMLSYSWDFGDGTKASTVTANHSYKKSGKYNVSLTVDDGSGTSCSKSTTGFTAEVNAGPVAVIDIR